MQDDYALLDFGTAEDIHNLVALVVPLKEHEDLSYFPSSSVGSVLLELILLSTL
jgi:hypothetical protein